MGERVALYLSFAMHVAADLSKHDFGPVNSVESLYVGAGRQLKETYLKYQAELDAFIKAKDGDQLIGILRAGRARRLRERGGHQGVQLAFHEYGSYTSSSSGSRASADSEAG